MVPRIRAPGRLTARSRSMDPRRRSGGWLSGSAERSPPVHGHAGRGSARSRRGPAWRGVARPYENEAQDGVGSPGARGALESPSSPAMASNVQGSIRAFMTITGRTVFGHVGNRRVHWPHRGQTRAMGLASEVGVGIEHRVGCVRRRELDRSHCLQAPGDGFPGRLGLKPAVIPATYPEASRSCLRPPGRVRIELANAA